MLFCFYRLVYPMLSVSLECPFLIAPSVFSNVYLKHFDKSLWAIKSQVLYVCKLRKEFLVNDDFDW